MKTKAPLWIDERAVIAIHDRLLAIHGGKSGLSDQGLLQPALARPRQHQAYAESPGIAEMATLYTAGIIRNHPFTDGHKRTGFVTGILFLELNGFDLKAREEDAPQAVMSLDAGTLDEIGYTELLQVHSTARRRQSLK